MSSFSHAMGPSLLLAALIVACAPGGESADTTGAAAAASTPASPLAQMAGRWDISSVPETGDTTAIRSVLTATSDTTGWTLTLQNRPPIPVRVRVDGDSIMTNAGPYESVIRAGVQVTTSAVYRVQGGMLVGTTTARYSTTGADSVLRLRSMGHKAP